jgi:hypothetical protein
MLEEHEKGKPATAFVNEYNCDIRTIQKAFDDARRERDATYARSELMKEALLNHQKRLEEEMRRIVTTLKVPETKSAPLSWYEDDNSIFTAARDTCDLPYTIGLAKNPGRPSLSSTTVTDLLRQHLRYDPLWKLLVQNEKVYVEHVKNKMAFQRKVVYLLEEKTGYKLRFRAEIKSPFLCSYTVGPVVFEYCLGVVFNERKREELEDELITDTETSTVKYRNSVLVEDPGNEKKSRQNILKAFNALLESCELKLVKESLKSLSECCDKVDQAADEISLLGYIPGSCSSCRRLGM